MITIPKEKVGNGTVGGRSSGWYEDEEETRGAEQSELVYLLVHLG